MRILVTGTAGFIGFHVARVLLDDGHEVVGYDNFNDYYSVRLKRDRHALLEKQHGYRGTEADLCDFESLQSVIKENKIDLVCHLAAQAGARCPLTALGSRMSADRRRRPKTAADRGRPTRWMRRDLDVYRMFGGATD